MFEPGFFEGGYFEAGYFEGVRQGATPATGQPGYFEAGFFEPGYYEPGYFEGGGIAETEPPSPQSGGGGLGWATLIPRGTKVQVTRRRHKKRSVAEGDSEAALIIAAQELRRWKVGQPAT